MTKLEKKFEEYENETTTFLGVIPESFDELYREVDELPDAARVGVAWLFSDSAGQALAVDWAD